MNRHGITFLVIIYTMTPWVVGAGNTNALLSLPVFSITNLSVRERVIFQQFRSNTNCDLRDIGAHKIPLIFVLRLGLQPAGIHLDKLRARLDRSDVIALLGCPSKTWSTNKYELLSYEVCDPAKHPPDPAELQFLPSYYHWLVITLLGGIVVDANPAVDPDSNGWIKLLAPYVEEGDSASDDGCGVSDDTIRRWIDEE